MFKRSVIQFIFFINLARISQAQVYDPIFKSVEMQATIAPLGEMVVGNFFGRTGIAAIAKSERAIYFFEPDSLENLILTDVVNLPDTAIAISAGKEVVIGKGAVGDPWSGLAVLMKSHYVELISFGKDGQPILSKEVKTDAYGTQIRTADLEASGRLDMVTFGRFSLGVSIADNTGSGKFVEAHQLKGPLGNIPFSDIVLTDFNGDLVPDIAALDWVNHRLLIFYGRGDGTFAPPVSFQLTAEPSALAVADLNGNGYLDIVLGYKRLSRIDIYTGDGSGRFYLRQKLKTAGPISKFAIADFRGDGTADIAALSELTKEITVFSYDTLTRSFRYAGAVGVGYDYDDIVPFYFPHRKRADLVASSPTEKYIKVLKSRVLFNKAPDFLVPVCSNPEFMSVCGTDTSNFLIVGNASGRISARYFRGAFSAGAHSAVDWQSEGTPNLTELISPTGASPRILVTYHNADMISLYSVQKTAKGIGVSTAQTAFLPFAATGAAFGDSSVIAAAYRMHPDSSVGISVFSSLKGKSEFIENDYSVDEKRDYVASALTINPTLSFLRVWRVAADTLRLAYSSFPDDKTFTLPVRASDAEFLRSSITGLPILASKSVDTLKLFELSLSSPGQVVLDTISQLPFNGSSLRTLGITSYDSTYYVTYFNRADSSVFLYTVKGDRSQFVKSWHIAVQPEDTSVSPLLNSIFFLNRRESYVSIHYF
ncbi:MAG: VCBS repeat-containing protein [Bacteroidetes bacterium]|nr:VCBS repeat-containing protein [Bacteroidota bacterium]